jgi:hypothetical protein
MGQANADGQGVIIEDKEGNQLFQLFGSDTPRQRVAVGGELRSVVTRYPGSSRPSTQIMGTQEDDLQFEGTFRDDQFGLAGHSIDQMTALRALWISQHYCELSWGSALVRRGYIRRVTFEVMAEGWIDYRFTFQVDEADEAAVLPTPFPPTETAFDLLALLREIQLAAESVAETATLINNVAHAVT